MSRIWIFRMPLQPWSCGYKLPTPLCQLCSSYSLFIFSAHCSAHTVRSVSPSHLPAVGDAKDLLFWSNNSLSPSVLLCLFICPIVATTTVTRDFRFNSYESPPRSISLPEACWAFSRTRRSLLLACKNLYFPSTLILIYRHVLHVGINVQGSRYNPERYSL